MPGPRTTLLIEGPFKELVEELADFIDNLKKSQGDTAKSTRAELAPLLEKYTEAEASGDEEKLEDARDDVLKAVVTSSAVLNASTDKGTIYLH